MPTTLVHNRLNNSTDQLSESSTCIANLCGVFHLLIVCLSSTYKSGWLHLVIAICRCVTSVDCVRQPEEHCVQVSAACNCGWSFLLP